MLRPHTEPQLAFPARIYFRNILDYFSWRANSLVGNPGLMDQRTHNTIAAVQNHWMVPRHGRVYYLEILFAHFYTDFLSCFALQSTDSGILSVVRGSGSSSTRLLNAGAWTYGEYVCI